MRPIAFLVVLAIGCGGGSSAPAECGDGFVSPDEECDDGNDADGDGCSADCFLETCGDGFVDPGEQCDDFNNLDGDGCSAQCNLEVCGNGSIDFGEECDDGNNADGDGCGATCVIEQSAITATWSFRDLATNGSNPCPNGFDTVAVHDVPLGPTGETPTGSEIIDLFTCSDLTGLVQLPGDRYRTTIEITDFANSSTFATSIPEILDIRTANASYAAEILLDGGYFQLAWTLRDASTNTALSCAQVAGLDSIEITATGSASVVTDKLDCAAGTGITLGLIADTYVTSVAALNASDQALGAPQNKANQTILAPNKVTGIGTFDLPID